MRTAILMIATLALLGACDESTVKTVPSNSDVQGPGNLHLGLAASVDAYKSVCVETFPSAAKARAVLRGKGFAPHPATSTFYDGKRDLSFSVAPREGKSSCSMVFASKVSPAKLRAHFAALDARIRFSPGIGSTGNGAPLYRALLWAK